MASLAASAMILISVMWSVVGVCFGAVSKVGDSNGWTNKANVDYKGWASNKTFFVGDAFFFQYDYKFNDVIEVSREDFESCSVRTPLNLYSSGRDSITIWKPGHYYYICSFSGHCQAGQQVDIRVLQAPNPTPGSSPSSTPPTPDPPLYPPSPTSSSIPPIPPSHPPSPATSSLNPPSSSLSPTSTPSTPNQPSHPPNLSPSSIPATPNHPPHSSPPIPSTPAGPWHSSLPVVEAPGPSKNTAPSSVSSKGLLALHLSMTLGFLAYY